MGQGIFNIFMAVVKHCQTDSQKNEFLYIATALNESSCFLIFLSGQYYYKFLTFAKVFFKNVSLPFFFLCEISFYHTLYTIIRVF